MRVFIAVDIGENIRRAMGDLQKRLADAADVKKGDVKWVDPGSVHITLKFLGEINDEKAAEVCNIVRDAAAASRRFELEVKSVGSFGGGSAKILWAGAGEHDGGLLGLQKDIERRMVLAGWPAEEREFTGHLTLCRIKSHKAGLKLADAAKQYRDIKLGVTAVDSVSVYSSDLTPKGPVYTVLGRYELGKI